MSARKKPNLPINDCKRLVSDLLDRSLVVDGERKLAHGAVRDLAKKFKMSERNIRRLWNKAKKNRDELGYYCCESTKKGKCGPQPIYDRDVLQEAMEELPSYERGNLRNLASRLGVGYGTIYRLKREENIIHPHSNALKPHLTDYHKMERIAYAADQVMKNEDGEHILSRCTRKFMLTRNGFSFLKQHSGSI